MSDDALREETLATPEGEARVVRQGAHVVHWRPRDAEPALFLSPRTARIAGRAIRGGVPIVFPWFGPRADDPAAPAHGFARILPWRVVAAADGTRALVLESDAATRASWPHDFALRYEVALQPRALSLTLEVSNLSTAPFAFEAALHTYLRVGDAPAARLTGLEGHAYLDKADGDRVSRLGDAPFILDGEVDRVFPGARGSCVVHDPVLGRRLVVDKTGSATTVLWNPGPARAAALADLGPDAWRDMVCVETANTGDDRVTLAPGARHRMSATLRCE